MGRMKRSRANNHMKNKNRLKALNERAEQGDVSDGMDDEIDKFHKNRDKVPLEDNDSEVDEFENPVFDLKGSESEDDAMDEDAQDDAMEVDDEELSDKEINDMVAKIEKQAKLLRQKRGVIDDEDDDEEEEGSEEGEKDWSKRKKAYYAADEAESSDEENAALEEAEARRLQQKITQSLRPEDFFQEDMDNEEETLEQLVAKSEKDGEVPLRKDPEVLTEKDSNLAEKPAEKDAEAELRSNTLSDDKPTEQVTKDFSSLTHEEKMQIVKSTAPEMIGLVNELRGGLDELQNVIEPLLEKMKKWNYVTEEGRNYVKMKHQLLIVYCRAILFYLLLKAEKKSVCDHPVIARLVETRQLLERVKVIDQRMKPQIEKFLALDIDAAMERKRLAETEKKSSGKVSKKPHETLQASVVKEEFIGEESKRMLKELTRLEEKAKRDSLLEQPPKKNSAIKHPFGRNNTVLDDYDDDVGGINSDLQPKKISQVIAEAGKRQKKPKKTSGDMDLPAREDLGERRRKREAQLPSRKDEHDQSEDQVHDKATSFEDDVYQDAKRLKLAKENQTAERYSRAPLSKTENQNPTADGKRHITREMEKNRGLTPYRKKASKNPRKKYKTKHNDAVIRRKGQVRDIRKESGPYGGEATGIRTNLSRSIRFT